MPRRARLAQGTDVMSCPSSKMRPERVGTSPITALIRLDLPAPFDPTSRTDSPARTSYRTSFSATMPPYRTDSFSIVSMVIPLRSHVGVDDVATCQHFGRCTLRQQPARLQHKDVWAEATNQFHVVLNDQIPQPREFPRIVDEAVDLRPLSPLEPGGGLVKEQEFGLGARTINSPSIFCWP